MDTRSVITVDGESIPLTVILYDPLTGDTQHVDMSHVHQDWLINARWLRDSRGGYLVTINLHEALRE